MIMITMILMLMLMLMLIMMMWRLDINDVRWTVQLLHVPRHFPKHISHVCVLAKGAPNYAMDEIARSLMRKTWSLANGDRDVDRPSIFAPSWRALGRNASKREGERARGKTTKQCSGRKTTRRHETPPRGSLTANLRDLLCGRFT